MFRDGAAAARRSGRAGFTLLEVLVAFTIAALAFGVLFKAIGGGVSAVQISGRYEEAVSRAQSHLAALGRAGDIQAGELQGDDGDGYHWRISVEPVGVTAPHKEGDDDNDEPAPASPLSLYKVIVAISWPSDGHTREVTLRTQRLGTVPQSSDN